MGQGSRSPGKSGKVEEPGRDAHLRASTNYAGARVANVNAATDLYGATSPEVAAVKAALSARSR